MLMAVMSQLRAFLVDNLDVWVSGAPPKDAPREFVTFERTGGQRLSVASEEVQVAIQCWAQSMERAEELAYTVDAVMPRFGYEPFIYRVERNSMYEFPGEDRDPRYQITYSIVHRV